MNAISVPSVRATRWVAPSARLHELREDLRSVGELAGFVTLIAVRKSRHSRAFHLLSLANGLRVLVTDSFSGRT